MSWFDFSSTIDQVFYRRYLRSFLLAVLFLEMLWRLWLQFSSFSWWQQYAEAVSWGLRLLFILWLLWQKIRQQQANSNVYRLMIIIGLLLGFWAALWKVIFNWQFWTVINLLAEPLLTMLVGLVLIYAINKILYWFKRTPSF